MSMGEVLLGNSGFDPRGNDMWMDANQSSARLFEKSKIKVLQGMLSSLCCHRTTDIIIFLNGNAQRLRGLREIACN